MPATTEISRDAQLLKRVPGLIFQYNTVRGMYKVHRESRDTESPDSLRFKKGFQKEATVLGFSNVSMTTIKPGKIRKLSVENSIL